MMTFQEAHRIIETARKHSEPVVDLANELLAMLEEDMGQTILYQRREIEKLQEENKKLKEKHVCHNTECVKNDSEVEKKPQGKKRGRPKKETPDIKQTAKELAEMMEV